MVFLNYQSLLHERVTIGDAEHAPNLGEPLVLGELIWPFFFWDLHPFQIENFPQPSHLVEKVHSELGGDTLNDFVVHVHSLIFHFLLDPEEEASEVGIRQHVED